MAKSKAKAASAKSAKTKSKPVPPAKKGSPSKPAKPSKATAVPPAPAKKVPAATQVKDLRSKYGEKIAKRPQKALVDVRREIRQAKQPLYNLNRRHSRQQQELQTRIEKDLRKLARQENKIKKQYPGRVPKKAQRELEALKKETQRIKRPLYNLNTKFNKERKELEAKITPQLAPLIGKREDYRSLVKAYDTIREQKKAAQRKLKTAKKQLAKADEEQDYEALEKLTYQVLRLEGDIDKFNDILGQEITRTEVEGYEPEEEETEKGWNEDPANPYTIWDAIKKLDQDLRSEQWEYFILNGKRFAKASIISIHIEASQFWLSLKKPKTDTPRVNRYYNLLTKTIKYIEFKS